MSYDHRPDPAIPIDAERCEAWCPPSLGQWMAWTKVWRRCCRRYGEWREGRRVCSIHHRSRSIYWSKPTC